ncbi:helix-turn-helix domain-containing protein [Moorena producens]|uniref:helix-turn-helix domain-containing protein n=1 Tax=Moorena producens TaxID=1155739 RepID=UPI003C711252
MMISTAQAADLLGVSPTRVRYLLSKGRVKGAYKVGRTWVIPLFDGMPVVTPGTRGPKRNWSKRRDQLLNLSKPAQIGVYLSLQIGQAHQMVNAINVKIPWGASQLQALSLLIKQVMS